MNTFCVMKLDTNELSKLILKFNLNSIHFFLSLYLIVLFCQLDDALQFAFGYKIMACGGDITGSLLNIWKIFKTKF